MIDNKSNRIFKLRAFVVVPPSSYVGVLNGLCTKFDL